MNSLYYNIYNNIYGKQVNESILDASAGNTASVLKLGSIKMYVPSLDKIVDIELKPIVNAVNNALGDISYKYEFMYDYIKNSRPQYVLSSPSDPRTVHKTMAVDDNGNLWMNVHFIYNDLNCDSKKIFGILFHELMHNFLDHIERSKKVFSMDARKKLYDINPTLLTHETIKQNLCADYEVNCNMVADGVVSADFWKEFGGFFDEKYFGKMWEEIYYTDGDKIIKDYLSKGSKLPPEYFEILAIILKALKVLYNPKSTDRDKDIAKKELEDALERLLGLRKKESGNIILDALKRLQKKKLKEIGEIGPYLKNVIDDLSISPRSMSDDDLNKFISDVETLKNELVKYADEVFDMFHISTPIFEKDAKECMDLLATTIKRIKEERLSEEKELKISKEVVYKIDRLIADKLKKKELDKKRDEEMKKTIEDKLKTHLLKKYNDLLIKFLSIPEEMGRYSDTTVRSINDLLNYVRPILSVYEKDEMEMEIKRIGIDKFERTINEISINLVNDLKGMIKSKILIGRDDEYIKGICDSFKKDNINLFKNINGEINDTEIISIIKIAMSSINRVYVELTKKKKVRPSDEYKDEYNKEYNRLKKIFDELGEKGLRKELGLPIIKK